MFHSVFEFAVRAATKPGFVLVIGGPTASGKSGLALELARKLGGAVINADSMQVYRDLAILTSRPGVEALKAVPHLLYGELSACDVCSAARWRDLAISAIFGAQAAGQVPVVTGGTGLYLRALLEGLAVVPSIPSEIRQAARLRLEVLGAAGLHAELGARDPDRALRLRPEDGQRLVRAWEVLEATGKSLSLWQKAGSDGPPPGLHFAIIVLDPSRPELYATCDGRFGAMVAAGALDEVRALVSSNLDPALPLMKALGVPELRRHLAGELSLDQSIALAQQSTRRYAKRQVTWFRHQLIGRDSSPLMVIRELWKLEQPEN
ncbi:MAG: tRNA (adenosine(37)-N6)-dimethylallyltransferase MiaA [Rhodospirillaceae bacterium]